MKGSPRASRLESRTALLAAGLLGLLVPALLHDLRLPDEPRVAHTGLEMARTGDWVVPRVNGKPFLQTPPLHYWALAAWFGIAGTEPDGAARVPSVLFSAGTLVLLARLASRTGGARASFAAAAILVGTTGFWNAGHRAVVDTSLTFFTTLAFSLLAPVILDGDLDPRRALALGAAAGGAFLAKGISGPILLILAAAACGLPRRELRSARAALFAALVLGACVAVSLPWAAALQARRPGALWELVFEHVKRRVLEGEHHDPGNFAFLHRSLLKLLPWAALLPFALALHIRALRGRGREARWSGFLLAWLCVPVVLLLLSRSKRELYLLPAYPAAAAIVGTWLAGWAAEPRRWRWVLPLLWASVLLIPAGGWCYRAFAEKEYDVSAFGRTLAGLEAQGRTVVGWRLHEREEAAIAWYLRHPFENCQEPETFLARVGSSEARSIVVAAEDDLRAMGETGERLLADRAITTVHELRRRRIVALVGRE